MSVVAIGTTERVLKCMFGLPDQDSHVMLWRWYQLYPHLKGK